MSYELPYSFQNRWNHNVVLSIVLQNEAEKALKLERMEMSNCEDGFILG